MNILLCDDDINFLKEFEKHFTGYDCKIYKYSSLEEAISSPVIFDIAFLDIVFDEGKLVFDLIENLRNKKQSCVIAFVTNHIKYAPEGYEYKAFRYILKNEPEPLIKRRLDDCFREHRRLNMLIRGSYKNEQFAISPKNVYYIEISNHILRFHTTSGVYEMYNSISAFYDDLLSCGFVRCHRSFVVNLGYVHTIRDDAFFVLNSGDKIPLGIRYKANAKEKYFNYTGGSL